MDARLNCPSCDNRYVPPPREGVYLCPMCRRRLPRRTARPRVRWLSGKVPALVLGTLFLIAAGGVTVRGRAASTASARAPMPDPVPEITMTTVRADARRSDLSIRAAHRRELLRNPHQSQPHAWAAYDILRELLDRSQIALPSPFGRAGAPMSEFSRQRQAFEQRQVQIEKYMVAQFPRDTRRAVRHAERAFQQAADPVEEMQARRLLGDAYRVAGRYDSAIRQYLWLSTVEPYGDRGMLIRCYLHKGLQFRAEPRDGAYWVQFDGKEWPIGSRSRKLYIDATQKWARRWPNSSFLRARLGRFHFEMAMEQAQQHPDFPRPGRDFGKRVDACIHQHASDLVDEGMRHFEAARQLAKTPWENARALSELGHGYMIRADYERAIPLLKQALTFEPWNRAAQDYLRQSYRRWGRGQGRIQTSLRPPPGWFFEGTGMPTLNTGFFGIGAGFTRLTTEQAVEARDLIECLRLGSLDDDRERLQEARNRLDELLPGSGSRFDRRTGDVLATDLDRATARLQRLERMGGISQATASASGGVGAAAPGFAARPTGMPSAGPPRFGGGPGFGPAGFGPSR